MSSQKPQSSNPPSLLRAALNKNVTLTLRIPHIYLVGTLKNFDSYSNLILTDVTEFERTDQGSKETRKIAGNVFIKGDSIVHIVF